MNQKAIRKLSEFAVDRAVDRLWSTARLICSALQLLCSLLVSVGRPGGRPTCFCNFSSCGSVDRPVPFFFHCARCACQSTECDRLPCSSAWPCAALLLWSAELQISGLSRMIVKKLYQLDFRSSPYISSVCRCGSLHVPVNSDQCVLSRFPCPEHIYRSSFIHIGARWRCRRNFLQVHTK